MEEWKDISGYEGYYQVSNYGRIKSLDVYVNNSLTSKRLSKGKIIIQSMKENGYMQVALSKENKVKNYYVHRLVAAAFCEMKPGCDVVNHINEIKHENMADNLEWCTQSHNLKHRNAMQRMVKSRNKRGCPSSEKPVSQYDLNGHHIRDYDSVAKASRSTGLLEEAIRGSLNPKKNNRRAGNYQWRHKTGDKYIGEYKNNALTPVLQFSIKGVLLAKYKSMTEASKCTNTNLSKINECCRGKRNHANNYKWMYDVLENVKEDDKGLVEDYF